MQSYEYVDALFVFTFGACCTYYAFRGVPVGTTKAIEWQQWYARWGRLLKIMGPVMMALGLLRGTFALPV